MTSAPRLCVRGAERRRRPGGSAEHLHGCSACAAQVASFGRVRKEFKNRPPIEPAGESLQRMTALLMQAATESAAASSPAATGGGGKILQLRSRGLRRLFLHPAGGVMAVAAAALFWVVFRAQPGSQSDISSPTSFQAVPGSASAPVGAALAPEPAVPHAVAPAEKNAPPGRGHRCLAGRRVPQARAGRRRWPARRQQGRQERPPQGRPRR